MAPEGEEPPSREETDELNRRELRRITRAALVYASLAAGSAVGAALTGGTVRVLFIGAGVLSGAAALWVALWALGARLLVYFDRVRR